ncbi:hypothetical protein AMTRI_Chr09g18230 [Amborella trichopoda]
MAWMVFVKWGDQMKMKGYCLRKPLMQVSSQPQWLIMLCSMVAIKKERLLEGLSLLQEMIERKIKPDFISYATLPYGLLKWNKIKMGLQFYDRMARPREKTLNKLARGLCRLSLCKEISLVDVETVFRRIGELAYRMTYNTVIKKLRSKGRVDDAMGVMKLMLERQTSPKFNQLGRVFDAGKVYAIALKGGIVPCQQPAEILVMETDFVKLAPFDTRFLILMQCI